MIHYFHGYGRIYFHYFIDRFVDIIRFSFRFSWVDDTVAGFAFPWTEEHFHFLREQGIDVILSFSNSPADQDLAKAYQMEVIHLPIIDMGIPSEETIDQFLDIVAKLKGKGKKIGVHCKYGMGRTGTMLAIYLIEFHQMRPKEALDKIRSLRPGSVESYMQEEFVLGYQPKRKKTT